MESATPVDSDGPSSSTALAGLLSNMSSSCIVSIFVGYLHRRGRHNEDLHAVFGGDDAVGIPKVRLRAETEAGEGNVFIYPSEAAHGLDALSGVRALRLVSGAEAYWLDGPGVSEPGGLLLAKVSAVIAMVVLVSTFLWEESSLRGCSIFRRDTRSLQATTFQGHSCFFSLRQSRPTQHPQLCRSSPCPIDLASNPR